MVNFNKYGLLKAAYCGSGNEKLWPIRLEKAMKRYQSLQFPQFEMSSITASQEELRKLTQDLVDHASVPTSMLNC